MSLDGKQNTITLPYKRSNSPLLDTSLKYYIKEQLQLIETSIASLVDAAPQVSEKEPQNPRRGMVRYAVSPWDPLGNTYEGLVVYDGTAWVQV